MDKKRKSVMILLVCAAAVLLLRFVMVRIPTGATIVYPDAATERSIEEPLTREEEVTIKKLLWGKIRWPKALYGFPACGFGRGYAIIIDGTRYMVAWDSCGTLCAEDADSDSGPFFYIDISDAEREMIDEIFDARDGR